MLANIETYCKLSNKNITPVEGTARNGAFVFKVLPSANDSIRILFENHTNLEVQPLFLPSVDTDEQYMVHPYARSGAREEMDYMRSRARLKGGEAMLFTLPVSWDINQVADNRFKSRFQTGRLLPGKYKIGLQLEVYMDTVFEVK